MSSLYTALKSIYEKKDYLNRSKPLEEFHISFRDFLIYELKKQTKYFNPYKFAMLYTMSPRDALNIFLVISNNSNVLKQYFAIECECGGVRIVESLGISIVCDECHEEITHDDNSYLRNVTLLFKLQNSIKKELQFDLKHQSSSDNLRSIEGEEAMRNPSLKDILTESNDEGLEGIKGMRDFAEKFRMELKC